MKKILSLLLSACLLFAILPCAAFAIDEEGEINAAKKAIRASESTFMCYNDMPLEAFLSEAAKLLPEGSSVELSIP